MVPWSVKSWIVASASLGAVWGCRPDVAAGFLPLEDQQSASSEVESLSPVTRDMFEGAIKLIATTYAPDVAGLGGTLDVVSAWDSDDVAAMSARSGTRYKTWVHGGMARRPEMTDDALLLILCHEMGHFFGGEPLGGSGLAAEGQADYFSTSVCLPRLWGAADNAPAPGTDVDPELDAAAVAACEAQFTQDAGWLCRRSLRAGWAAMHMAAARRDLPAPAFSTPDQAVVDETRLSYPGHQCRLDTMSAGALGGERPLCWFKPE